MKIVSNLVTSVASRKKPAKYLKLQEITSIAMKLTAFAPGNSYGYETDEGEKLIKKLKSLVEEL